MTLGEVLRGLQLPTAPVVVFGCDACVPEEAPAPAPPAAAAAEEEAGMISCAFHNDRPPAEANHLLPGAGAGYVAIIVASTFRGEYDTAGTAAIGRTDVIVVAVAVAVEEEASRR